MFMKHRYQDKRLDEGFWLSPQFDSSFSGLKFCITALQFSLLIITSCIIHVSVCMIVFNNFQVYKNLLTAHIGFPKILTHA